MDSKKRKKRIIAAALIIVILGVSATVALFVLSEEQGAGTARPLPPNCLKPEGGFLVVASDTGYNDSMGHFEVGKSWPIITVRQGQNVTIVVCNIDVQPHGFQIVNYDDKQELTITPGQVYRVSFIANQVGTFTIYCEIFCTVHSYMQSGLLNVTAA